VKTASLYLVWFPRYMLEITNMQHSTPALDPSQLQMSITQISFKKTDVNLRIFIQLYSKHIGKISGKSKILSGKHRLS